MSHARKQKRTREAKVLGLHLGPRARLFPGSQGHARGFHKQARKKGSS